MFIPRSHLLDRISQSVESHRVTALLGPRQCGKTTLAREVANEHGAEYFDLENPAHARRLGEPMTALEPLKGLVVIDEAQLQVGLFPVLRVLADRVPLPARFLLLGSASPDLIRGGSESLAGRISFIDMTGFTLDEVGVNHLRLLWFRGGFPGSYLAKNDSLSLRWREDFIQTFLERDLRRFGIEIPPATLRRFWEMLVHYHGQIWNASELGRALGMAHTTIKRHLDILSGALMVRQLQPWFENIGKRQVKSPKIYFRDSGLLHAMQGFDTWASLEGHPRLGASWEGFVIEEILGITGERQAYFWNVPSGAELDLLLTLRGRRYGFEVKYSDAPAITRSLRTAKEDLRLETAFMVVPGSESYSLEKGFEILSIRDLRTRLKSLGARN